MLELITYLIFYPLIPTAVPYYTVRKIADRFETDRWKTMGFAYILCVCLAVAVCVYIRHVVQNQAIVTSNGQAIEEQSALFKMQLLLLIGALTFWAIFDSLYFMCKRGYVYCKNKGWTVELISSQSSAKYCSILATLAYVILFPLLCYVALLSLAAFEAPEISLPMAISIMIIAFLVPLSMPFSIYLMWSKYAKQDYHTSRRSCGLPIVVFGVVVFLNTVLEVALL